MFCVSVREKRRFVIRIYIFLMVEMFYSFERCFTLFDLPLYSFTSVGVNRSDKRSNDNNDDNNARVIIGTMIIIMMIIIIEG